MEEIEIGKTYKGMVNGCLLEVLRIFKSESGYEMVEFLELHNNKKDQMSVQRFKHSKFVKIN